MQLYPRHRLIIEHLSAHSPNSFTLESIAISLRMSKKTLANELPQLINAGHIRRAIKGRTFEYYVSLGSPAIPVEPISVPDYAGIALYMAEPDYSPKLIELAWNFTKCIGEISAAIHESTSLTASRANLEKLLEAVQEFSSTVKRFLATDRLWEDPQGWFLATAGEADLEKLPEISAQLLKAAAQTAKLEPKQQG